MKKGDVFLILLVLLLFAGCLLSQKKGTDAAIYIDGELYKKVSLSKDEVIVIESDYGKNTILIKDGKISVSDSDCKGKDCMKQGTSTTSRSIVCLPNRLSIIIEETKNETDVIV